MIPSSILSVHVAQHGSFSKIFQKSGSWQMLIGLLMRRLFFSIKKTAMKSWALAFLPQKLSCRRWKQVSTAMVPSISCHNPLPHKLPRQRQLQSCRGDLEGMIRDVFFFSRAGAWVDKVYPVHPEIFAFWTHHQWKFCSGEGLCKQITSFPFKMHWARWVSILYIMLTNIHGD